MSYMSLFKDSHQKDQWQALPNVEPKHSPNVGDTTTEQTVHAFQLKMTVSIVSINLRCNSIVNATRLALVLVFLMFFKLGCRN